MDKEAARKTIVSTVNSLPFHSRPNKTYIRNVPILYRLLDIATYLSASI